MCLSVRASSELEDQTRRAMELEQERKRAREEADRLEIERQAAEEAKAELARQSADQQKTQEQLVGGGPSVSDRGGLRSTLLFIYFFICFLFQAAELAEFTAKIALLEDAKRKKDEEATEWQHKVRDPPSSKERWRELSRALSPRRLCQPRRTWRRPRRS